MTQSSEWKEIRIAASGEEPLVVKVKFNSAELAKRGQEILDDDQRPLDVKEREHALTRSTVYRLP